MFIVVYSTLRLSRERTSLVTASSSISSQDAEGLSPQWLNSMLGRSETYATEDSFKLPAPGLGPSFQLLPWPKGLSQDELACVATLLGEGPHTWDGMEALGRSVLVPGGRQARPQWPVKSYRNLIGTLV